MRTISLLRSAVSVLAARLAITPMRHDFWNVGLSKSFNNGRSGAGSGNKRMRRRAGYFYPHSSTRQHQRYFRQCSLCQTPAELRDGHEPRPSGPGMDVSKPSRQAIRNALRNEAKEATRFTNDKWRPLFDARWGERAR
jgi:hypothetical protein